MSTPTIAQLKQAITIAEQIAKLQSELASIVGGGSSVASAPAAFRSSPIKIRLRTMSPATIAKMRAAQQARWAKKKGATASPVEAPAKAAKGKAPAKAKRKLSPEGRARIVAALKARWAAKKKAAK